MFCLQKRTIFILYSAFDFGKEEYEGERRRQERERKRGERRGSYFPS
jgi:hypothetical protein